MAERLGTRARRNGMGSRVAPYAGAAVVGLLLVLAGCGDTDTSPGGEQGPPSESVDVCVRTKGAPEADLALDLDGDGTPETVRYVGYDDCPDVLEAEVAGTKVSARLSEGLPLAPGDLHAVQLPGRSGQVLLATAQHPRGGFQARLYGYADGALDELTVEGKPVFDFVATDVPGDPVAARCTSEGFEVTRARAHEPVGVVPAWDVVRTPYTVEGNTVTQGPTTEVADNVLDEQLRRDYRDLLRHTLFADCRVDR